MPNIMFTLTERFGLGLILCVSILFLNLTHYPFWNWSYFDHPVLNFYLNYESSTLPIAITLVVVLRFMRQHPTNYLTIMKLSAPVQPIPWLGISDTDNWRTLGLTIGSIISIVTGLVMYLTIPITHTIDIISFIWILLLALLNAFCEEVVFRYSYVQLLQNNPNGQRISLFLGTVVFGAIHYFGVAPSGWSGFIMASLMGWFLTKSLIETRGFFWALMIHWLQDIIIISMLVAGN